MFKVKPGLSTFRDDPSKAGDSLKPLFEFAAKHVPAGPYTSPLFSST